MARDWENQFTQWAKAPSQTEQDRCDNALAIVRNAIKNSAKLSGIASAFAQGSYRNRTNVRQESDVDIGVLCTSTFFYELPPGGTPAAHQIIPATYTYAEFRADLGAALKNYLGGTAVTPGPITFDVHETSYHVDADVTPFFGYKLYQTGRPTLEGVAFDKNAPLASRVVNWPEQHYANGVARNDETKRQFKALVRVFKALAIEMKEAGYASPPSFLIECLVYNTPSAQYLDLSYFEAVRSIILFVFTATKVGQNCSGWREVNGIKALFGSHQKWTQEQANAFVTHAWNYIGFK
jgi:hypothetical protein